MDCVDWVYYYVCACVVIVAFLFNSISLLNIARCFIFFNAYKMVYKSVQTNANTNGIYWAHLFDYYCCCFFHSIDSNQNVTHFYQYARLFFFSFFLFSFVSFGLIMNCTRAYIVNVSKHLAFSSFGNTSKVINARFYEAFQSKRSKKIEYA